MGDDVLGRLHHQLVDRGAAVAAQHLVARLAEPVELGAVGELDATLAASGIELCFAEMKDPVKDKLKSFGLYLPLGEQAFFPTVEVAVSKYVAAHATS